MTRWLRFADWPLRAKLATLLVVASLLPLAIWAYIDLRQDQARRLEGVKNLLEARGDQIVRELDSFHRGHERSVDRLARFPDSAAYCAETPERRGVRHAAMLGILAAYTPATPASAALRDRRLRTRRHRDGNTTDRSEPPRSTQRPPGAAGPQRDHRSLRVLPCKRIGADDRLLRAGGRPHKRVVGVAVLWVRATALWNAVKTSNALAGPGSFAVLFDREGIRIAHTYSDDIVFHPGGRLEPSTVERLAAERRFGSRTRELLEDVRAFPDQFERARAPSPDLSVFRGFAPVNGVWNTASRAASRPCRGRCSTWCPKPAIAAEIAQATRARVLLALAVITAAGIIGLVFAASILKPIRALGRTAASIAGGQPLGPRSGPAR